ncbi:hypothetical protein [Serratia marcescens]|uniref:hypothetical protein n=1 Tax=Serratia marcescens TaxID=615 RepID=UPI0019814259|nr:hypothetical protein [Serratia marcescens]MBN3978568.1 hypothetical protein [Serratia marcescens]
MDIDAVSRALHALNMIYQGYAYALGMSQAFFALGEKYQLCSNRLMRQAMTLKYKALIAHDQMLTGDNHE